MTAAANDLPAKIATLTERVDMALVKLGQIEQTIKENEEKRSQFRLDYEGRIVKVEQRTEEAHTRILQHEEADKPKWATVDALKLEVQALRDTVQELRHNNKILVWFSGIVGSTSIVLAFTTIWEKFIQ